MEREEFIFTPLVEFDYFRGEVLIAHYMPGMTYNCTRHPRHDTLYQKCAEWEQQGKIRKIPLQGAQQFKTVEVK